MKFVWWLFLCAAAILPQFTDAYASGCDSQCSLEEIQRYWSDCCCVQCGSNGSYVDLPDGVSVDDYFLPQWICCNNRKSYVVYLIVCCFFLVNFYTDLLYWLRGHALTPTSIVELSRSTGSEEEKTLDLEPRSTLSGRVVRYVFLRANNNAAIQDHPTDHPRGQQPSPQQPIFADNEYSAEVDLFHPNKGTIDGGQQTITISLKSYYAYKKLQEFCQARDGKWWITATNDTADPTNGYHLLTTGADNKRLLMYRPYHYDSRWKWEFLIFSSLSLLHTLRFLSEVRPQRSILIVVFTNILAVLLATRCKLRKTTEGSALKDPLFENAEIQRNPGSTTTTTVV